MAMSGALMVLAVATATAQDAGPAYNLYVDGLACPFCAYGIEKQLSKIEGVEKIDIDIGAGAVTVTMARGAKLDAPTGRF